MFDVNLYRRMVKTSLKYLGARNTIPTLGFPAYSAFVHATMALDRVLFPAVNGVEVKNPVFILGHPRSGTTFFHRLLTQTDEFPTFELWELMMPSLTGRKLIKPFVDRIGEKFREKAYDNADAMFSDGAHETGAHAVEEEELLLNFLMDTQMFTFLTPLAFDDEDWIELVFSDHQPERRRRRSTRFLRECFRRHILDTGKGQILAKMPYSTLRIKSLMAEFPDAKFLYIVRSPLETIPSHLSLHRSFFANRWGLDKLDKEALQRYYLRRYRHNLDLYRYFYDLHKQGELPPDRVKIIRYDLFLKDLENAFNELVEFTAIPASDALRAKVKEQARQQKAYKRTHKNLNLEEFGLTTEQLLKDFDFVFEEYGFDRTL